MMAPPKVLIAGDIRELPAAVDQIRGQLHDVEFEMAAPPGLRALNGNAAAAAALVVEIDLTADDAIGAFRALAGSGPDRKVIAAARNAGADDVRKLFRAGAADVLTTPFTPQALASALAEVFETRRVQAPMTGQTITLLKSAGGVGATTLGLNLAASLAQGLRKAASGRSTAFLDLDLQFGDADVALNVEPRSTVLDVLRDQDRFDSRFLAGAMMEHPSGLKLLAAPRSVVPLDAMSPAFAAQIMAQASRLSDLTIIDLPRAWTDWTLQVLKRSTLILLVGTPTVQGALGARRVLDALREAAVDAEILFLLNKLTGMVDAFEKPSRISRSLERPVDAALVFDSTARRAADRGELVVRAFPKSRLSRELKSLAGRIDQTLIRLAEPQRQATGVAA